MLVRAVTSHLPGEMLIWCLNEELRKHVEPQFAQSLFLRPVLALDPDHLAAVHVGQAKPLGSFQYVDLTAGYHSRRFQENVDRFPHPHIGPLRTLEIVT